MIHDKPAFPQPDNITLSGEGLSKVEYYAAFAMLGILSRSTELLTPSKYDLISSTAFGIARAMLSEGDKA